MGHLILHRAVEQKSLRKKDVFNLVESQAHLFAGEFLLPERSFKEDLATPSLEAFRALKAKWRLSIAFMIRRSGELGMIPPAQVTQFHKYCSGRGWRKREPLDDILEPETPRLLRQSFDVLFEHKVIVPHDIPFRLGLEPKDVEDLAGLPAGYLDRSSREVGLPRLKDEADRPEVERLPPRGDVMRFPGHGKRKSS